MLNKYVQNYLSNQRTILTKKYVKICTHHLSN